MKIFLKCRRHGHRTFKQCVKNGTDRYGRPTYQCQLCTCDRSKLKRVRAKENKKRVVEEIEHYLMEGKDNMQTQYFFKSHVRKTAAHYENDDVMFLDKKGQQVGYAFLDKINKKVGLVRCPSCRRENYASSIITGRCAWCGFNALLFLESEIKSVAAKETRETKTIENKPIINEKKETTMSTSTFKKYTHESSVAPVKKPEFDWEMVSPLRYSSSSRYEDRIIIKKKSKMLAHNVPSHRLDLTIGGNVADKLNLQKGDRVLIFRDSNKPHFFLLRKSNTEAGYKISAPQGSKCFNTGVTLRDDLLLLANKPFSVKYDFLDGDSIVIDTSLVEEF